jgi:hypothetical protein
MPTIASHFLLGYMCSTPLTHYFHIAYQRGYKVSMSHAFTDFPKIYEPPQKPRCHESSAVTGAMKQVPYQGSTVLE